MSFGDPNNPYGQQPQGQQPGYGYPQQGQQPGYGYPAAPPVSPYGAPGYGVPMEMPGGVKAARVILWVLSGLQLIGAVFIFIGAAAIKSVDTSDLSSSDAETFSSLGQGLLVFVGVLALIFAALSMFLAARFKSGGNGVRVGTIVYGAFLALSGVFSLPAGILSLALAVLVIVFVAKSDGAAWFQRQR